MADLGILVNNNEVMPYDIQASISSSDETGWVRVAKAIIQRRFELGMTQAELARRAGTTISTMSLLQRGQFKDGQRKKTLHQRTAYGVEVALGWKRDSIEKLLFDGAEPELTSEGEQQAQLSAENRELFQQVDLLQSKVDELEQRLNSFINAAKKL